ncbi:MAG: hypothetical protein HYU74_13210 [Dechloromonas sp.]|nr:hypothetical protein [Dechloromonas sp.]
MFDFRIFSKQIGDLRGQVNQLTEQIDAKQRELDHLRNSPPPKSDVLEAMQFIFQVRADAAAKHICASFAQWQSRPMSLTDPERVAGHFHVMNAVSQGSAPTPTTLEHALLALLGQELEKGAARILNRMNWPEAGPPIADRPALIERAEQELIQLNETLETIRKQAATAGLLI